MVAQLAEDQAVGEEARRAGLGQQLESERKTQPVGNPRACSRLWFLAGACVLEVETLTIPSLQHHSQRQRNNHSKRD